MCIRQHSPLLAFWYYTQRVVCLDRSRSRILPDAWPNLSVCDHYGPNKQRRMLRCQTCKTRFSERKGTPLFGSTLPEEKALSLLQHVGEGCGVRKTSRLTGVHRDTVTRYSRLAGKHAHDVHDELVAFSPEDP